MPSDIDILLKHSAQLDSLKAAHQSEFSILLEDKKQLRDALCNEHEENSKLKTIIEAKDEEIMLLKQRVADIEKQTVVNNIAGPYIENNHVKKMYVRIGNHRQSKKSIQNHNQPQLQLWGT